MKSSKPNKKVDELELMPIPFDDIMRRALQVPPKPVVAKKPKAKTKKKK
jgi:hypothetical protein